MPNVTVTKNSCEIDALYQWDVNQELVIDGLTLPNVTDVHYAHDSDRTAIVQPATVDEDGVIRSAIPDALLQQPYKINAYLCAADEEAGTFQTLFKIVIPVVPRAMPGDYGSN